MDLKKIKVCIFDVNGVLIDSNLANAKAMGKAFSDDPYKNLEEWGKKRLLQIPGYD